MVKTIKSFVAILALGQCLLALDGIECLALANQPTMRINASNRRRNRRRHMMQRRRRARRERQKNRSNRQISMQGININRKARSLPQPNTTLYTTTSSYNYNRPIITQPSSIPQMPIGTMTRIGDKIHRVLCDNKFVPLTNVATSKQIKYAGLIIDDKKVTVTIDYNRIASEGISSPCVEIRNLDSNPIVFNLLHFATALTDESRISFLEVIQEDQKIDVSRKIRFTIDKLEYNVNPLYFAIYFNREDVVKKLLDIAKDKDQLDKICDLQETKILTTGLQEKYTILHRAILSESSDKITQHILDALEDKIGLLLNTKTDIKYDEFETSNCSPFLLAIFYGNVAIVNKLLTTAKTYKINSIWDACNHMIYKNEHLINPTPHQIAKFFNKNDIIELLNQAEKSSITSPQPPTSVPQPQHPSEHRPQPMTSVPPQITLTQVQLILNDIAVCLVLNSNHNCEYTLDETKKIAKFNNVIIKGQNATLDINYNDLVTKGLNSDCVILNGGYLTLRGLADYLYANAKQMLLNIIKNLEAQYSQPAKPAPHYPSSPTPAHHPATYQKPQGSAPMLTSEQPQHPSEHRPQPPTSVPPQITLTQVQLILDDIALCLVLNSNHNCEYTLDETKKIAKFNNAIIKGQNATLDINYNDLVTKGLNSDCVILNGGYLTLRGLADYLYANAKQTLLNIIKNLETQYSQSAPKPPQPLYKQPTAPHYPPSYTPAHQPVKIVAPKPSAYQSPQAYHPGSAPVFTKSALLHQSSQPTLNKGQVELIGIVRGIINNILDGQITQEPGNPHKIKYTGLLANPFIIDYMELVTNGLNSRCVILNDNHLTLNELADKLYDRAVREELNQAITDLKPVFSQQQVTPNAPVARSNTLTQDDVKNITNTISGLLTNENRDCQVRKNTTSDIIEYTNIKIYDTYNHTDIKKTIYIDYSKLANEGLENPCVKINYNNSDKFFTILHLAAILKPSKVGINLLKTIKGHKTFNISAICPYKLVCTPDLDLTVLEFAIAIGNMDFARELLNIAKEQNKLHSILKASTGKFTTKSMGQLSKLIDIENSTILHRMIAHCRTDAIGVLLEAFKGDQNALKAMLLSKAVYKTSIEWSQDSGTYEVNDCTPLILAMNSENRDVAKAILDAAQTLDKPALSEIINSTCTFNLNVSGFVKITRCTPYILSIIPHFVNQKARIYMQNILTDIAKNNNIDILNATCDIDSYLVEMRNVTPLHILGHGNILSSKPGDNYEYAKMLLDKSKWLGKERIRNALLAKADYKYKKNDNSRNVIGVEDGTPLHFGATNKEFIRLITIHGCASNTINQNDILNDPCKNIIMRDGTTAQGITPYSIAILTTTDNEIHFLLNPNKN